MQFVWNYINTHVICIHDKVLLLCTIYYMYLYFTGKSISGIVDKVKRQNSNVLHLHVTGDTLVVPRIDECKVLYFKLE